MKNNYIASLSVLLLTGFSLTACRSGSQPPTVTEEKSAHAEYAKKDTSLNYLLQPVNAQVIAAIPVINGKRASAIYIREIPGRVNYDTRSQVSLSSRVAGRIEKLYIKYNYQPVKKGQLILELYSPDLAAAQRELLLIKSSGSDDQLMQAAKQRLELLGMGTAQIQQVLKSGQISYRIPVYSNATGYILEKDAAVSPLQSPVTGSSGSAGDMDGMNSGSGEVSPGNSGKTEASTTGTPVLLREGQYVAAGQGIFNIYKTGNLVAEFALTPKDAAQLDKNSKVIIQTVPATTSGISGKIGLIQPVFNTGENFTLVRVYLQGSGLQAGELLTGHLPFLTSKAFWLPHKAVLSLGNQSVIFKKEGKVLIPESVKTGVSQNGLIQILDDITDWEIAENAHYLIDSESFIKIQNHGK